MANGANSGDDGNWMFSPRLPAVIPLPRTPVIIPLPRRFAVPFWGLILLAMSGSVLAGALAATLWPWGYYSHGKKFGVATRPRGDDRVSVSNLDESALAATEVTKIDLSPASLSTTNLSPANLNTSKLNTPNLNTPGLNAPNPNADNLNTASLNLHKNGVPRPDMAEPITVAPPAPAAPVLVRPAAAEPSVQSVYDTCHAKVSGPQLVLNLNRTVLRSGEPASLGLRVDNAHDGARLLICGFAAQSVFSTGHSLDESAWTIPAAMAADATILPPRGFAGPMDLSVLLLNADKSLADRRVVHLQWLPPAQPSSQATAPPPRDAAGQDPLLSYGAHLRAIGSLADARQVFSRVAQKGDPRGAFLLAETYDPISLAKHQLLPKDSDIELARIWYRKATELGSQDAPSRLERLTNW
jgi:uncharacterized protein YjbI with pentapeptide repeats